MTNFAKFLFTMTIFRQTPKILFLSAGLLLAACVREQAPVRATRPEKEPASYGAESAFFCKIKALDQNDKIRVFVRVELRRGYEPMNVEKFINRFAGNFVLQADYNKKEYLASGSIFFTPETVILTGNNVFDIQMEIAKPNIQTALLVVEVSDLTTRQKAGDEMPVRITAGKITDRFAFFSPSQPTPLLVSYTHTGDTLQIRNLSQDAQSFFAMRFKNEAEAAFSPMNTAARYRPVNSLKVDSVFKVPANQLFTVQTKGLYFFSTDTSRTDGLTLLVTDKRFPKVMQTAELLRPLIYISTNEEINEVKASTEKENKKTLDRFWLRLSNGNEDLARRTIKLYFRRVMQANQLFTTYKEGWQTDMGMVFIVFGPPDKINRLRDRQVWSYTGNPNFSEINFTFLKRPNALSENNFELQRYAEYEPIWYPIVEVWRSGSID
jgi:GWxTD domain-containing protein